MKYAKHLYSILGILFLILGQKAGAREREIVRVGTLMTDSDGFWDEVLELSFDTKLVKFYHDKHDERHVTLSVSTQGEEYLLWEHDRIDPPSGRIPEHVLLAGMINENSNMDILLCYSDDCGTGQGSDCWTQKMRLFFDWQSGGGEPIPLSSIDRYLTGKETSQAYYIGEHGEPATAQEALMLLFPAFEKQVCTIYVWSKKTVFEHPLSGTAQTLSYHIYEYQIERDLFAAKETLKGSHQRTADFLHDTLQAWREQEDAPSPLFLNFSKHAPYLWDETEWFQYFTKLEEW